MTTEWNMKANSHIQWDKQTLQNTNMVSLPPCVLKDISEEKTPYQFQLTNPLTGLKTYVGVKDFDASDQNIILPYWVYNLLGCNDDSFLTINLLGPILKGKLVTFQPEEEEFFSIPDYDACLEQILINYPIVHNNQTICFELLDRNYHITIKEIEPDWEDIGNLTETSPSPLEVISIIDVDLKVNIFNKFLEKQLLKEKMEKERLEKERLEKERLDKKRKLTESTDIYEPMEQLSKDELRHRRLKYFCKTSDDIIDL